MTACSTNRRLIRECGIAQDLSTQRIDTEQDVRVAGGVAGALVGLLLSHAVKPDADLLAQAIYCAEHLLNLRVTAGDGHTWRNADGLVANGLADGSAGVVLALLQTLHGQPGSTLAGNARVRSSASGRFPLRRRATPRDRNIGSRSWIGAGGTALRGSACPGWRCCLCSVGRPCVRKSIPLSRLCCTKAAEAAYITIAAALANRSVV
ncbi:MAG: hypothetical protein R2873_18315 [Caldilineaceae bacterium]